MDPDAQQPPRPPPCPDCGSLQVTDANKDWWHCLSCYFLWRREA